MSANITANPLETWGDELERYALEECIKRHRFDSSLSVLVLRDKRAELAIRFARLGAKVVVADRTDVKQEIEGRVLAAGFRDEISVAACTITDIPESVPCEPFDIIVVRRGLCALPYDEARRVVRQLLLKLKIGGKLYVSVLGLHSELSEGYAAAESVINERFGKLAPALAEKYGIHQPVCLYTERNLFMLLLEAGASVLRTLTTTYGNVKGIGVRV
ncbi:MAG: class I SAM-dependent methyltransferase [Dechloromonas sp.]|nr:class I SAM-dependent methyltransferase [Dechloromonas sp.]